MSFHELMSGDPMTSLVDPHGVLISEL